MATNTNQVTLIQFIGDYKGYLTVSQGTVFPVTMSIADIKDLTKKTGTFSKSITVDGTKDNNKLLGNYFDVNIQASSFNINRLQRCNVIQDGVPILENMLIQLVSINKKQTNSYHEQMVTYTLLIKDSLGDFFTSINNKYLHDIDFSYLNHFYTAENVILSYNHNVTDGFKYVMPYSPTTGDADIDTTFDLTEFSPAIYAQNYFDAIFANAGYSYRWDSATGSTIQFDKLLIPYNGDIISINNEEQPLDYVEAHKITEQTYVNTYLANFYGIWGTDAAVLPTDIEDSDVSNLFNNTAFTYSFNAVPSYSTNVEVEVEIDYEFYIQNDHGSTVWLRNANPNGARLLADCQVITKRNTIQEGNVNVFPTYTFQPQPTAYNVGTTMLSSGTSIMNFTMYGCSAGDVFQTNTFFSLQASSDFSFYRFFNAPNTTGSGDRVTDASIRFKVKDARVKYRTFATGDYGFNTPINMNLFIPKQIKQNDFVKSIFTMFNLFAEPDEDDKKLLVLTPRDEYYDSGESKNWTSKLAKELPQDIKFLPELQNKKLLLTYKADKDVANVAYTQSTNEIYGQYLYTFENEYTKDVTTKDLIFSPTPMTDSPTLKAVLPLWAGGQPNVNIRILYDGGTYPCTAYSIINYPNGSSNSTNGYPFISHQDKPTNPTYDINFGVCTHYLRSDDYGSNTNNNLFNLHWRRTLGQINNGKMLTASFILTPLDIRNLKLNDKIRIDNSWWNINKVADYDANSDKPTKVELNSIDDDLVLYTEFQPILLDRNNDIIGIPKNIVTASALRKRNTMINDVPTIVNGVGNFVGPSAGGGSITGNFNRVNSSSTIVGNNNSVEASSPSIVIGSFNSATTSTFMVGSNNVITSGVTNAVVLGNNLTVTNNDTLYANNIVVPSGGTITFNNTTFSSITDTYWTSGSTTGSVRTINTVNPNTASGAFSIAMGLGTTTSAIGAFACGEGTTASGNYSHAEGFLTIASGTAAHVEGQSTIASDYCHAEGYESVATGAGASHAEGFQTLASGANTHAEGYGTKAFGVASHAEGFSATTLHSVCHAGGYKSSTSSYGEWCRSSDGDIGQYGIISVQTQTVDATPTTLDVGPLGTNAFFIPINTAYRWTATAVASNIGTGDAKEWNGNGLIKNVGGTTSMVGSLFTSTYGDAGLATTNLIISADNATDTLKFDATGIAATTINWFVRVDYVMVT